nr:hypothetical protein [Deltaproteobacteria bacterium]
MTVVDAGGGVDVPATPTDLGRADAPEVGQGLDVHSIDAPSLDAGRDASVVDAGPAPAPPRDGCDCRVATGASPGAGAGALLTALGLIVASPRRRRRLPPPPRR